VDVTSRAEVGEFPLAAEVGSKPWGHFLEVWDVVGDMMKRHRVLGENRHVRLKECAAIQRTYFHHENTGGAGCGCPDGGAAFRAEVSGHSSFNIRALE